MKRFRSLFRKAIIPIDENEPKLIKTDVKYTSTLYLKVYWKMLQLMHYISQLPAFMKWILYLHGTFPKGMALPKHIANATIRSKLEFLAQNEDFKLPIICTPEELLS